MSTRKGEAKKSQKYKNKSAYEVRFNQKLLEVNAKAPLDHLCSRCMEQIKWKIQFGKYKPKTTMTRCNKCHDKSINKAYRTVCDKCSDKEKVCSKCGEQKHIMDAPKAAKVDRNGVDKELLNKMEDYLEDLRERSKRTVMRKLMKGEVEFKDGLFVSTETGEPLKNLTFKGDADELEDNWGDDDDEDLDEDDDEDDMDDDDEDDDEEKKVDNKKGGAAGKATENKKVTIVEPTKGKGEEAKGKGKEEAKDNKGKGKPQPQKGKKKPDSEDEDDDDDDFDDDDEDY